MSVRISFVILIVALFLLAESFMMGAPNPGAIQISELLPAAAQPP